MCYNTSMGELVSHEEVFNYLCWYDRRHPQWAEVHEMLDPEDIREPRQDCSCDNCFYKRDVLAREIIRLRESISTET